MRILKKSIIAVLLCSLFYFILAFHTETEQYNIINAIFSDINFTPDKICEEAVVAAVDERVFAEFSFFDKLSVYSQAGMQIFNKKFEFSNAIKSGKIKYTNKSGRLLYAEVLQDCATGMREKKVDGRVVFQMRSLTAISFPIISIDRHSAVMQIETYCGALCGESYCYFFKKVDGKWRIVKKELQWIS